MWIWQDFHVNTVMGRFLLSPSPYLLLCLGPSGFPMFRMASFSIPGTEPSPQVGAQSGTWLKATKILPQRDTTLPQAPFWPWVSTLWLLLLILISLFLKMWNTHITGSQVIRVTQKLSTSRTHNSVASFYSQVWKTAARSDWVYSWFLWAPKNCPLEEKSNSPTQENRAALPSGKPTSPELLILPHNVKACLWMRDSLTNLIQ